MTLTVESDVQYRHLIPAPADRTSASAWLYKHPRKTYKYDNLNISMTHVDCKSEVRSVIRSFLHQYPKKWVAIGHVVVYYARSAHRFSARIKCRHCKIPSFLLLFKEAVESDVMVIQAWVRQTIILRLVQNTCKDTNIFENHLNHVMWVFIGKHLLITLT